MISELEGYRLDAILLNETWRPDKSEFWETHHIHVQENTTTNTEFGIVLNKNGDEKIIDNEYISERATSQQRVWSTINVSS